MPLLAYEGIKRGCHLLKSISIFLIIIIASTLILYLNQRRLMYYPIKQPVNPQGFAAADARIVKLTTKDNVKLTAWYFAAANNNATIVFFHGNAGHLGYRMGTVNALRKHGFGVFLLSYRGYGDSEGAPSEQGLYADGRAAMDWLIKQGVTPGCSVLFGESLGTGVATKMATEYKVAAVVLQSPYTSMDNLGKVHYPALLLKPWDKYASIDRIDKINAPLYIYHGMQDRIVPIEQGEQLYRKAKQPKQMFIIKNRGHNDLVSYDVITQITKFINQHLTQCN